MDTGFKPEPETAARLAATGTLAEIVSGVAAVVLAILALAGVLARPLTAIATIAAGAAVMFEGWALSARFAELQSEAGTAPITPAGGGMTAETLAGGAAIVLGILALVRVAALPLVLVSAIILGGALLLGSAARARLNALRMQVHEQNEVNRAIAQEAAAASTGAEVLVGVAGTVLGILGLSAAGTTSAVLAQAAMLCFGASVLASGTDLGARLLGFIHY